MRDRPGLRVVSSIQSKVSSGRRTVALAESVAPPQPSLRSPDHGTARSRRDPSRLRVLLVAEDGADSRSIVRALASEHVEAEWVRTLSELQWRTTRDDLRTPNLVFLDLHLPDADGEEAVRVIHTGFPDAMVVALGETIDGDRAARLLGMGVPSLSRPASPLALADLALQLSSNGRRLRAAMFGQAGPARECVGDLEAILDSYALKRSLSQQQRLILRLYLSGRNDKEIARACGCAEATVYEHWRRMGRKAGGCRKSDVIADFHRFLGGDDAI